MQAPITISNIADLIAHNYTFRAHCENCRHSGVVNLEQLGERLGSDHSYLRTELAGKFKCSVCKGREVAGIISPPTRLVPGSVSTERPQFTQ